MLAPGGMALVTVPAFMFLWSEHDVVNQHRRRYRRPQLAALLAAAGSPSSASPTSTFTSFPSRTADRLASRLARRRAAAELRCRAPWVNRLMGQTFRSERHRVADRAGAPFPSASRCWRSAARS